MERAVSRVLVAAVSQCLPIVTLSTIVATDQTRKTASQDPAKASLVSEYDSLLCGRGIFYTVKVVKL